MKITEQNFVSQMIQGNEKALEYVMLHYGGLVKSVVHRYLYVLPQKNPFANWIAGVARIKALDYKRRYAARLLEMSWEEAERCGGKDMMAEISQIEEEFSEETRQMLECLSPQDRELFLKIYVEEENVETVSAQSGLSRPVIYNRLSRGKKKIRRLFSRT